jgi:hypothetical protein
MNVLLEKKVKIVPIVRDGTWLGKGHDGEFMYSGCQQSFVLPIDLKRGGLVNPFGNGEEAKELQNYFETEMNIKPGSMSVYKKKDSFWHTFRVSVDKDGSELNLNNLLDNLKWRVLQVVPQVASSWKDRYKSAEYKFALVDGEHIVEDKVKRTDLLMKAYKHLDDINASETKMKDLLRVFYGSSGRVTATTSRKQMVAMLGNIIDESEVPGSLRKFISIIEDKDYATKVFIQDTLEAGALVKFEKTKYKMAGGTDNDAVANNETELIEFLQNKKNSVIKKTLETQIKNSK